MHVKSANMYNIKKYIGLHAYYKMYHWSLLK